MAEKPTLAVFRPDDERLVEAVTYLEQNDCVALADPMLEIVPTDNVPRADADVVIITSTTGVDQLQAGGWDQAEVTLCAIGEKTATALETAGYSVDIIPEEYTSSGLVKRLMGTIDGKKVEIARSGHGSTVLPDGLIDAGAYVHETILYRLSRPAESGTSTSALVAGELDGVLFTSPLTVKHFIESAREREIESAVRSGMEEVVVGAIGQPTAEAAQEQGIGVDVIPPKASFPTLADAVCKKIQ